MMEAERTSEIRRFAHNILFLAEKRKSQPAIADEYTRYLDGLKGYCNRVIDFEFIMQFNPSVTFGDFLEGIEFAGIATDYAGFHATDPNWYEEGNYETGVLEPELFGQLERHFKTRRLLEDDQKLEPIIHFAKRPHGQHYGGIFQFRNVRRADMVINVSGGERDGWGQFITCWLEDGFDPFHLNKNPDAIDTFRTLARETGKQEITSEEYWKAYEESKIKALIV